MGEMVRPRSQCVARMSNASRIVGGAASGVARAREEGVVQRIPGGDCHTCRTPLRQVFQASVRTARAEACHSIPAPIASAAHPVAGPGQASPRTQSFAATLDPGPLR